MMCTVLIHLSLFGAGGEGKAMKPLESKGYQ